MTWKTATDYLRRDLPHMDAEQLEALEAELRGILAQITQARAVVVGPREIAIPSTPIDCHNPPYPGIRAALKALFEVEGLKRWAAERWPELRNRWGGGFDVDDVIDAINEYVRTRLLWDELVAEIAAEARRRGLAVNRDSGYDLQQVRRLMVNAFNYDDLRRMAFYSPTFRAALEGAGTGGGLAGMADHLVAWAEARDLLPALLKEVEQSNPRQYRNYAPFLVKR